ncbi:NAD-dependent epimerase/dehydratase family protein [Streptomyces sp. bgisy027]|uniref:NAD-dependent epimerase/dehydratase family protein n=1 Tax=Streptomyces sp. bgisy027 TaxID=3413770 RepID=UPI003D71FB4A
MAQVLVIGGSGFIGSWCVLRLLEAGHDVRTTVRDLGREPALRAQLHAATGFDDGRPARTCAATSAATSSVGPIPRG